MLLSLWLPSNITYVVLWTSATRRAVWYHPKPSSRNIDGSVTFSKQENTFSSRHIRVMTWWNSGDNGIARVLAVLLWVTNRFRSRYNFFGRRSGAESVLGGPLRDSGTPYSSRMYSESTFWWPWSVRFWGAGTILTCSTGKPSRAPRRTFEISVSGSGTNPPNILMTNCSAQLNLGLGISTPSELRRRGFLL